MRMRLARNYNYNTHEDASRLRDTGQSGDTRENLKADSELLAKLHKRNSSSLLEDEDVFLEQVLLSDENSATVNEEESEGGANEKERSMLKEDVSCHVIMLMDRIPGHLKITNKHIISSPVQGKMQANCVSFYCLFCCRFYCRCCYSCCCCCSSCFLLIFVPCVDAVALVAVVLVAIVLFLLMLFSCCYCCCCCFCCYSGCCSSIS